MKILTRLAMVVAALAVAAPALPCGLMQHSADASTPTPTVAQDQKAQKAGDKGQAKAAAKAPAAQKKTTVATK